MQRVAWSTRMKGKPKSGLVLVQVMVQVMVMVMV